MERLRFNADGLIPAIIQQAEGRRTRHGPHGRVLMMAWINREALEKTLATGFMHYWSRSRQKLWLKGESSGHRQEVVEWFKDCDGDTLAVHRAPAGRGVPHGLRELFLPADEPRRHTRRKSRRNRCSMRRRCTGENDE